MAKSSRRGVIARNIQKGKHFAWDKFAKARLKNNTRKIKASKLTLKHK